MVIPFFLSADVPSADGWQKHTHACVHLSSQAERREIAVRKRGNQCFVEVVRVWHACCEHSNQRARMILLYKYYSLYFILFELQGILAQYIELSNL